MTDQRIGHRVVGMLILLFTGLGVAGCSSSPAEKAEPAVENLQTISEAYGQYIHASRGQPPRSAKDLEKYLRQKGEPNTILRSPNDGQPYVIFWGVSLAEPALRVLAHEKDGSGGSRYVLLTDGSIERMGQAQFDKAPKPGQ